MRLDAVLDQPGVHAQLVARVVLDVFDVIRSCSPALFSTTHTGTSPAASSVSQQGGLIQFSGL